LQCAWLFILIRGVKREAGEAATLAAGTAGSDHVAALPSHRDIVLRREVTHKLTLFNTEAKKQEPTAKI
jgi:hypothetical protein